MGVLNLWASLFSDCDYYIVNWRKFFSSGNFWPKSASEVTSEHLISKKFLGEHPPVPPSCCVLTHTAIICPPPLSNVFHHLWLEIFKVQKCQYKSVSAKVSTPCQSSHYDCSLVGKPKSLILATSQYKHITLLSPQKRFRNSWASAIACDRTNNPLICWGTKKFWVVLYNIITLIGM